MAQPSNTYDSYDLVGAREGLTNIIENISPTDVPFQSNIGRSKVTSILYEFQTDALSAAASNSVIEGDDSAAEAQVATAAGAGQGVRAPLRSHAAGHGTV